MDAPDTESRPPRRQRSRWGGPMRFEHGQETCDRRGHIASCCEGDAGTLAADPSGRSSND